MKKILLTLALAFGMIATQADIVTGGLTNNTFSLISTGAKTVTSITLMTPTTATNGVTVRFYDHNSTTLANTNAAYTNWVSYSTNVISTVVTVTGITNNYTNTAIVQVANPVAAVTNVATPFLITFVPAASVVTITEPYGLMRGLCVSNYSADITNTSVNYIVNYRSQQ